MHFSIIRYEMDGVYSIVYGIDLKRRWPTQNHATVLVMVYQR